MASLQQQARDTMNRITPEDKLLSSAEVAVLIGKSVAWLARMRWAGGGIPYKKIGRHVRYQRSVVMRWLDDQPTMKSTSQSE